MKLKTRKLTFCVQLQEVTDNSYAQQHSGHKIDKTGQMKVDNNNNNNNNNKKASTPKRVRFALVSGKESAVKASYRKASHCLLESDIDRCWWTGRDFDSFREDAIRVAESIHCGGVDWVWENSARRSYCKTMARAYKYIRTAPLPKKNASGNNNQKPIMLISKSTKHDLDFWVRVGHERRGLERFIVSAMGIDRQQRREIAVKSVLHIYRRGQEEGLSATQIETLMRAASEKESIFSNRFATIMGQADAAAAKGELNEQTATRDKKMVQQNEKQQEEQKEQEQEQEQEREQEREQGQRQQQEQEQQHDEDTRSTSKRNKKTSNTAMCKNPYDYAPLYSNHYYQNTVYSLTA